LPSLPRVTERDSDQQGDDDLRRFDRPRSCVDADQYTATVIGLQSRPISEGKEFTSIIDGVQGIT
jgi:hypothetical protein